MENSILNSFPVDPGIFLIVLLILNMILIIVTIRCTFYYKRLYRGYDVFMRGKDAETLENTIMNLVEYTEEIGAQNESINRLLAEKIDGSRIDKVRLFLHEKAHEKALRQ